MPERSGEGGQLRRRAALAAAGAAAGAAAWIVAERLPELIGNAHLSLFATALTAGFLAALMALAGALPPARAALAAAAVALPASVLFALAALRYDRIGPFLARPETPLAFALIVLIPLPYAIAALRPGTHWRDYPTLFAESWGIAVRVASAWLFAGVVWLAVLLSDQLLRLAGIGLIERALDVAWMPATFTGLAVGLSLALVVEMEESLSPALVLRLLRVLAPPALVVVGAFVLAIPFRGLDQAFGTLSPAQTLLAFGVAVATLVTAAAGADDDSAARGPVVQTAARGLALLLPVVAGCALWALWLRIGAVGLSPGRLAALAAGLLLLAYGLFYAAAVVAGAGWTARIRSANGGLALAVAAVAALSMTPVLNAERLSAGDQVDRFRSGRTAPDAVDVWTLRHDWGRAGRAALDRIAAAAEDHPGAADLRARIALSATAPDRFAFGTEATSPADIARRADLKAEMPVVPATAAADFDRYVLPWYAGSVGAFLDGCRDRTADGRPGCVLVVHDLLPDNPGEEAVLFYKSFGLLRGEVIVPEPVFRRAEATEVFGAVAPDFDETDAILEALQDGAFTAGPARLNAITVGPRQFTVPY